MNRPIKFRAWDKGKMIEPMGLLLRDAPKWLDELSSEAILMQYTGMKDKNGKEIYEGDICRFDVREGGVGEPAYHGLVGQVGFSFGCYTIGDFLSHYHSLEVIGNIYENPELLEGNR
jgi:hypothetical protein